MEWRLFKVALVQIASVFVLLVIALVAYSTVADHRAETKAHALCDGLKTGDNATDLSSLARANGADMRQTREENLGSGQQSIAITFTGALLSRHVCVVRSLGGKVLDAQYMYLD